jgi:TPR repeat protein
MNRLSLLIISLLAVSSCGGTDREQAIFDFINKGEPENALSVLSLSECELYLDPCAKLGAGLVGYEGFEDEGIEYLLRAAAGGHARANFIVGNFLIAGTILERDPASGIGYLKRSVELGASEGMYYLANEYHKGENIEKDVEAALDLYIRSSELGHIYAPYNAGVIHWELHQDCAVTEKYFAMGAPFMDDAQKALEEIRTLEPCASELSK